ncbi:MAG: AAA family ATPase [Myxococcota bacterium]
MLRRLYMRGVGPAPTLDLEFAPRLNILTGDNGLGKSFVLDLVWWAHTRTWAGLPAVPHGDDPRLVVEGAMGKLAFDYAYDNQRWKNTSVDGGMPPDGLVIYARVDGGFRVWDRLRNSYSPFFPELNERAPDLPAAFDLSAQAVFDGLVRRGRVACNGLVRDWVDWMRQRSAQSADASSQVPVAFDVLEAVLAELSPSEQEMLVPGPPARVFIDDVRDIPTLALPHEPRPLPLTLASAGLRRIVSFAYVLVWAWVEHCQAAQVLRTTPRTRMTLLIDEFELHLHPQWQRRILPALLEALGRLSPALDVQIVATTHAPLVLASVESRFEPRRDRLFNLSIEEGQVRFEALEWAKHGNAARWLTSSVFGLERATSRESERALGAADAFMRGALDELPSDLDSRNKIDAELHRVLAAGDPFWVRWVSSEEIAS